MIEQGHAYPCWMTTQELDEIRQTQRLAKQPPGVYGHFSQWRDASVEKIQTAHVSGDAFVIRMRTPYTYGDRKVYPDIIRGEVETLCPFLDSVLLKGDGFPTYHLAHLVDDYLMGTTHVIRAEEWLASVPLHVTLFELCGLTPPQYAHTAQLLKQDNGNKRKLSKRKDPEADVRGLVAQGFATQGILEYVMTIFSPDFELWQQDNVDKNYLDLPLTLEKMNASGALVDFDKMLQVNRNYLARLSNEELYDKTLAWATVHDEKLA